MMTETSDETSVMPPASAPPEDTVATVAPTHAPANRRSSRRPSDHIQPPPEPFSPYAFPPTYEEAMVSKQLEEGNLSLTPEVIATLHTRTNCPGRPRRIASEIRPQLSSQDSRHLFVRQRALFLRICLYTFILLIVIGAITIAVIRSTEDIPPRTGETPAPLKTPLISTTAKSISLIVSTSS